MNKKHKIILASVLGALLLVGGVVAKASSGNLLDQIADRTGFYFAQLLNGNLGDSNSSPVMGAAGDTYQTAKVYSKIITSNSTTAASIACNGWLVKGVKFYETPGAGNSATTTIAVGVAANSTTTTLSTTLDSATFSTSTAVYVTADTADGAGQLCSSSEYIKAIMGSAVTTTNGVLSVEYLNYQ